MTASPVWLLRSVVEAAHDAQIEEHGGSAGLRDAGLLDSALSRPLNLFAYGEPSGFELAAAYAFGIARNHPFLDGNKRTALLAAYIFLRLNGWRLVASEVDTVRTVLSLVTGAIGEAEFAAWLEANCEVAV